MSGIRLHVRGQMGVQILQTFMALSNIHEDENPTIVINTGGDLAYDASNHLGKLFEPQFPVQEQDEIRKTPYWYEGCAKTIFKNRKRIIDRWMHVNPAPEGHVLNTPDLLEKIAKTPSGVRLQTALHVRGSDKKVMSTESYVRFGKVAKNEQAEIDDDEPLLLFTDDLEFARPIVDGLDAVYVSDGSAVYDWVDMFNTTHLFAAPSAFVITMLLIDPEKKITFAGPSYYDGEYAGVHQDLGFIEEAMAFCPNVRVLK